MKKRDVAFFAFWVFFPLMIILFPFFLNGCTPAEIRITEEVAEEVLEKELEESNQPPQHKSVLIKKRKMYHHEHS